MVTTPKVPPKLFIKEIDKMGNETKEKTDSEENIILRFQFVHLKNEKIIRVEGSRDEAVLSALRRSEYFESELEKSKKKGILIHASEKLKAMVKGSLPCGLLPPYELLKITFDIQEQPEEGIVSGKDWKLFCVAARGQTEKKGTRLILLCKRLRDLGTRLAVCAPANERLLNALKNDGRFEDSHFKNVFYLCPPDDSGNAEPFSEVRYLKDPAITYTLIITGNPLLQRNEQQEEKPESFAAGQGDKTSTSKPGAMQDTSSKTSTAAQKEDMRVCIQHRFETSLLKHYKNLKFQGELFEEAFKEEKKKKGRSKGPFEICIEEFGKEIKNVTPIVVHELLVKLGRSVGYMEWINELGIRRGQATCFVLHGCYIITNHHVIRMIVGEEAAGASWHIVSDKVSKLARISFDYKTSLCLGDEIWFNIECLIFWNPDLDYAVLKLKEKGGTSPEKEIPPGLVQNIPNDIPDELMYIIGHPDGGPKATDICRIISYSERPSEFDEKLKKRCAKICNPVYCARVFPNQYIECFHMLSQKSAESKERHFPLLQNPDTVAYDTSFFEGSSGSPVFSSNGALIALHSAGYTGKYKWTKQYIMEFGYSIKAIHADIIGHNKQVFQDLKDVKMEVD